MESIPQHESETAPFLLFRAQKHLCALPLAYVVETMRPLPVEAVAGVPDVVKGLSVIRGISVPVVDLGYLLNNEGQSATRFITVQTGANCVALAVQSVMGLHYLRIAALREIPPLLSEAADGVVESIATLDAELLLVLDTAQLVPESLWELISAAGDNS